MSKLHMEIFRDKASFPRIKIIISYENKIRYMYTRITDENHIHALIISQNIWHGFIICKLANSDFCNMLRLRGCTSTVFN